MNSINPVWSHVNTLLVEASSPEEAYRKALELGEDHNHTYLNTDGQEVVCRFRGLRELFVIHGELGHGTELVYERKEKMTAEEIKKMVKDKGELAVFAPIKPIDADPNYFPQSIAEALRELDKS